MADTFQTRSEAFIQWFKSLPAASINPKIALHDFRNRGGGRGVVALEDIAPEERLFLIPRESILSADTSTLRSLAPDLPTNPWLCLILVLIFEHLQGAKSPWKPYLDILPTESDFDTLMYWSQPELDHLQASAVGDKIGKSTADDEFRVLILPFVQKHASVFYPEGAPRLSPVELLALCHRMGSTIMAYAFDLEPTDDSRPIDDEGFVSDDDEEVLWKGMLPLADMLNADVPSNAHLFNGVEGLAMTAVRLIAKGEEILNSYGALPRSDLLRRYGYITPQYEEYDVVEISHELLMKHVRAETDKLGLTADDLDKRLEHLDEMGILDESYDIEKGDVSAPSAPDRVAVPDDLIRLLQVLLAQGVDHRKLHRLSDAQLLALMHSVGRVSLGVLQERLGQYASSAAEDRALLARGNLGSRERMAVEVRLGEKSILEDAVVLARSWIAAEPAKASAPEEAADAPAPKRQRTG